MQCDEPQFIVVTAARRNKKLIDEVKPNVELLVWSSALFHFVESHDAVNCAGLHSRLYVRYDFQRSPRIIAPTHSRFSIAIQSFNSFTLLFLFFSQAAGLALLAVAGLYRIPATTITSVTWWFLTLLQFALFYFTLPYFTLLCFALTGVLTFICRTLCEYKLLPIWLHNEYVVRLLWCDEMWSKLMRCSLIRFRAVLPWLMSDQIRSDHATLSDRFTAVLVGIPLNDQYPPLWYHLPLYPVMSCAVLCCNVM